MLCVAGIQYFNITGRRYAPDGTVVVSKAAGWDSLVSWNHGESDNSNVNYEDRVKVLIGKIRRYLTVDGFICDGGFTILLYKHLTSKRFHSVVTLVHAVILNASSVTHYKLKQNIFKLNFFSKYSNTYLSTTIFLSFYY